MRLPDVDTGRLLGLKYKLICHFKLATDMIGGGIWEFVNDVDGLEFLKRELRGLGVDDVYWWVRVNDRAREPVPPLHVLRQCDLFLQCKTHFLHWSWYTRLDYLQLARVVKG